MQKQAVHDRVKKYAGMDVDQVYDALSLSHRGLGEDRLTFMRQKYGSNDISSGKQDSIMSCIRRAFINPFSIILFCLGIISFITDVLIPSDFHKNLTSVLIIFSMLILSGGVRLLQELRSKRVADRLINLVNTSVSVLRDGRVVELSASDLLVGDYVLLAAGDRVPADIRITKAKDLFVSQSVITGESLILEKTASVLSSSPSDFSDYENILFGGSTLVGGLGEGIVVAVGKDTVYGSIGVTEPDRKHGFDQGANSIAWVLIRFMVILVPIVFIASGITKDNWFEAFLFALSVAVGLTPELLPMVVNACLARGSYLMGQKQTIVKNINAMQGFGSMDVLCVDKTGTLTGDQLTLEYYMDILGNESKKTLDYAYLAAYYHTGVGNHIDHAIMKAESMPGKEAYYKDLVLNHPKVDEHPFDYSRRFSSVLVKDEEGDLLIIKGSVDDVIRRCNRTEYKGCIAVMDGDPSASVHSVVDDMAEDGMQVIALAYKRIGYSEAFASSDDDYILLGYLAFFDAPNQTASSAIDKLKNQSVSIRVLTGDQALVAMSICSRLGIDTGKVLTGKELSLVSENDLPMVIEKTNVFAELSPKQKAMIVETLESNGHCVGYLGDGMNDLPAILQADVGISVEHATEAVQESADVILLKKDLNVLEEGIIEGRRAFANMQKYIKITASSNFGNIVAIVFASVLLPFFPMTSIQLLLLNLLYDILCLILPWDKVDEEMLRKPLEWSGRRLGSFMTFFGPLSSVFDLVTFAFLFFVLCPLYCGGAFTDLSSTGQALFISMFQTGWFLESMWTQVLILQLLRTRKLPFIQSRPGKMVVLVTILGIILFTLLPLSALGEMIGLTRLPVPYYLFLVSVVMLYLLLVTAMKSIYVRRSGSLI